MNKQENTKREFKVGQMAETIDNPTGFTPKQFEILTVDDDLGVVGYIDTNGQYDTIGVAYIQPLTL